MSIAQWVLNSLSNYSCKKPCCFDHMTVAAGHAYFPAILNRIPHSSINSAITRKAWYEDTDKQKQIHILLQKPSNLEDGSERAECSRVHQQLLADCPEAHKQLSTLLDSEHLNVTVFALLNLLRRGDIQISARKMMIRS